MITKLRRKLHSSLEHLLGEDSILLRPVSDFIPSMPSNLTTYATLTTFAAACASSPVAPKSTIEIIDLSDESESQLESKPHQTQGMYESSIEIAKWLIEHGKAKDTLHMKREWDTAKEVTMYSHAFTLGGTSYKVTFYDVGKNQTITQDDHLEISVSNSDETLNYRIKGNGKLSHLVGASIFVGSTATFTDYKLDGTHDHNEVPNRVLFLSDGSRLKTVYEIQNDTMYTLSNQVNGLANQVYEQVLVTVKDKLLKK